MAKLTATPAIDLEVGDIIHGHTEGITWRLRSEVLRVEEQSTRHGQTSVLVLIGTTEGRHIIHLHRHTELDVFRG